VNAVSPGPIDTPGLNDLVASTGVAEQRLKTLSTFVPLGRLGTPDGIARAVVFLASDDSSFITGTELFVPGRIPGTNGDRRFAWLSKAAGRRGRSPSGNPTAKTCCAKSPPVRIADVARPDFGRQATLDADALSADSRAHQTTRGHPTRSSHLLKAGDGVDGRRGKWPRGV